VPTKFGAFLLSRGFHKLFCLCYVALVCISAAATAYASYVLLGIKWLTLPIGLIFAVTAILTLYQRSYKTRKVKMLLAFLRCTVIYYNLWFIPCALTAFFPFGTAYTDAVCILSALPLAIFTVRRSNVENEPL